MRAWRAILAVVGISLLLAAPLVAFVTLSVPAMRDHPRLGLILAAAVFVISLWGVTMAFRRRK